MADAIKTVRIVSDETESGFIRVNEANYDPTVHKLFKGKEEGLYASKSKAELVDLAEERKIDSSGTKSDIIERLEEADAAAAK